MINEISFIGILVISIYIGRYIAGSWLPPGVIYSVIWAIFIIFPILIIGKNESLEIIGFIWIILIVILGLFCSISIGIYSTSKILNHEGSRIFYLKNEKHSFHRMVLLISVILGSLAPFYAIINYGFDIKNISSIFSFVEIGNAISVIRYNDSTEESIIVKVLKQFVYISPGIGGSLHAIYNKKKDKYQSLICFIPSIFWTLTQTTKASILFSIIIYISWYLSISLYFKKSAKISTYFSKSNILMAANIVLLFLIITNAIRYKTFNLNLIFEKFLNGFVAQIFLFSDWFSQNWKSLDAPTFGQYTFSGPFAVVAGRERITGLGYLPQVTENFNSNIYTIHRGLIEDFHLTGALIFFIALFTISSTAYCKIYTSKKFPIFNILVLASSYSVIFWSPVVNFFNYNSNIISYFICYLFLLLLYKNDFQEIKSNHINNQ